MKTYFRLLKYPEKIERTDQAFNLYSKKWGKVDEQTVGNTFSETIFLPHRRKITNTFVQQQLSADAKASTLPNGNVR